MTNDILNPRVDRREVERLQDPPVARLEELDREHPGHAEFQGNPQGELDSLLRELRGQVRRGRHDIGADPVGLHGFDHGPCRGLSGGAARDESGQLVWLISRTVYDGLGRVELSTDRFIGTAASPNDVTGVAVPMKRSVESSTRPRPS